MLSVKTLTLAILGASIALVNAAPGVDRTETVRKSSIKLCGDKNYGNCEEIEFTIKACTPVGQLNDKVSSLDTRNKYCKFWVDTGCRDGHGHFAYNGLLPDIRHNKDGQINNKNDDISSFICW
ncbi:Hypothetical protein D9617_19g102250 [Elsinoe fawcettii]|nr:Hypothetical protein D9617_19g102250 [Elsinoe fawcettii]